MSRRSISSFSRAHICQCLTRLRTLRRRFDVVVSTHGRWTGEQLVEGVLSLASGLHHLGVRPGDVVAVSAFNSDNYLEWLLAVAYVGGIVAPLNYRWSFEESIHALENVKPVMLVIDESFRWQLDYQSLDTLSSVRWCVRMGSLPSIPGSREDVLTLEMLRRPPSETYHLGYLWAPDDVALICFTSGTTGRPKGATITHSSLIIQSLAKIAIVGYNEDDVYLHTAPLCHIGGISSGLAILTAGGCHIFMPKFETKLAVEAIEQNHVTSFITVPTIMSDLVSSIRLKTEWAGKRTVKKILNGGGSLSVELLKDATEFFPSAKIFSAYGMTETCSSMTFVTLHDPASVEQYAWKSRTIRSDEPRGICVGKPAPHVEMMIDDKDSCSGSGRILTRGPHVMVRYWSGPDAVEAAKENLCPDTEDWFDTGDIGRMDDHGNLWLVGRNKDRIKSGGENVFPEEVESVLSQHPGIRGVVVVGVPDARLTEMVVACIQIREKWRWTDWRSSNYQGKGTYLSSETLKQYCKQMKLSGFKIPKGFIVVRKPFPRTSTGKLKREEVQREAVLQVQSSLSSRM